MEIHTPDKPIHSKKEFMFHMFTVVLGILIALGLEGVVEWAHHRSLVREARANIASELHNNQATLGKAIPEIRKRQEQLQQIISAMDQVEADRKFKPQSLSYNLTNYELYSTAWKTASVSGAVTYMDYEELKKYSDVYDLQQDFIYLQGQAFSSVGDLSASMKVLDRDLTKVPIEQIEQIQRESLKILAIQKALETIATVLLPEYEKAIR